MHADGLANAGRQLRPEARAQLFAIRSNARLREKAILINSIAYNIEIPEKRGFHIV
jgi:hypothetical protein